MICIKIIAWKIPATVEFGIILYKSSLLKMYFLGMLIFMQTENYINWNILVYKNSVKNCSMNMN